jgi:hypothetical protein
MQLVAGSLKAAESTKSDKEKVMKTIGLKRIVWMPVIFLSLLAAGFNWPVLLMSSKSSLLAHSGRSDWDREDSYYQEGFRAGRQDAKRNLSYDYRRHRGAYNNRNDSDFRRGYDAGYASRYDRNSSSRSRGYGAPGYGGYGNPGYGGYGSPSYSGLGVMNWRGRVDDYVELRIQGSRVQSRERQGAPTFDERYNFSSPLPRAEVQMSVKKREGRGRVHLIQQPSRWNGYTAVIAIDDDKGGADDYELEVKWQ